MSRESVRNALQELSTMTVRLLWTCPHGEGFLSYPKAQGTHHPDILSMQYLPPPPPELGPCPQFPIPTQNPSPTSAPAARTFPGRSSVPHSFICSGTVGLSSSPKALPGLSYLPPHNSPLGALQGRPLLSGRSPHSPVWLATHSREATPREGFCPPPSLPTRGGRLLPRATAGSPWHQVRGGGEPMSGCQI